MKKTFYLILNLIFTTSLFAFDWPVNNINEDSYSSYFGQNRGKIISSSLCFSEPGEIKAAESGYILAIISENNDDSDFFPSTLGTAVILSHGDNLLSVYGNIDNESLTLNDVNEKMVDSGAILGNTGNSGWQDEKSHLEFQIIDTKEKSAINPMVLMPRAEKSIPLTLTGIYIENKNHDFFDINTHKTYPSGLYRIYQKRNAIAVPYKTSVSINGLVLDQLSYDTITTENKLICISGKKKYTYNDIYPTKDLHLIGEAMLAPGKITLGLTENDILGNAKHLNYNITVR